MFVLLYIHIRYIYIYGMSFVRPQHHNQSNPLPPHPLLTSQRNPTTCTMDRMMTTQRNAFLA